MCIRDRSKSAEFGHLVLSAVLAGLYVIVLVISTDLGSALIFFMMYLFMVYVGTKKVRYLFIGMAGISTASVIAYKLFSHVPVSYTHLESIICLPHKLVIRIASEEYPEVDSNVD